MSFDFHLPLLDTVATATAGVEMAIKDLRGKEAQLNSKGQPIVLRLMGVDSPAYQALQIASVRRGNERVAAKASEDAQIAGRLDDNTHTIAGCIIGWQGMLDSSGSEIQFGPEAALELVRRFPAIRAQIEDFVTDRANFLQVSPQS